MSRISDSRDPQGGIGFPILQHHRYDSHGWSLSERGCIIGVRVEDRDDDKGGLGAWQRPKGEENVGDLTQWLLWPRNTRAISGFAQAWPAILTGGGGAPTPPGAPPPPGQQGGQSPVDPSNPVVVVGAEANPFAGFFGGTPGASFSGVKTNYSGGKPGASFGGQTHFGGGKIQWTFPPDPPDANSSKYQDKKTGKFLAEKYKADAQAAGFAFKKKPGKKVVPGGAVAPPPSPPAPMVKGGGDLAGVSMLPSGGAALAADGRYSPITPLFPVGNNGQRLWPKFPLGWHGVSLPATNEAQQIEYFLPTDPRLISANKAGDYQMGSLVCDLTKDFEVDPDRMAHIQSLVRTIKNPVSDLVDFGGANALAWQIGQSGLGDTRGGLVFDMKTENIITGSIGGMISIQGPTKGIMGMASSNQSGPLNVGSSGDVHHIGEDADGNPINALHVDANAYFKRGSEDGPLNLTTWQPGGIFQKNAQVWCGFNPNLPHRFLDETRPGKWDWWTTVPDYVPTGPPRVPPDEPWDMHTPTFGPPDSPTERPPVLPPVPTLTPLAVPAEPQGTLARVSDTMVPSVLGRPQMIQAGIPDLRKTTSGVPQETMDAHDAAAPVTARVEAYGRQAACEWNYTQRPTASRFVGGTAPGGFMVMPPELDMADDLNSWTIPACRAVSTTYFSVLRGSYFAAGLPNLVTGGMKTAHRWGEDASGNLTFEAIDSEGAATGALQLPTGGGATIAVGTSGSWMRPIGMVGADLSTVGTPATLVETTLDTITVPANSVTASGRGLRIKAFGTFAANDNAKTIKLKIGGVTIVTNDMSTVPNGSTWEMDAVVFRGPDVGHGPTTKVCAEAWVGAVSQSKSYATPALDYTAALPVIATGQNGVATANDIVGEGLFVEALG